MLKYQGIKNAFTGITILLLLLEESACSRFDQYHFKKRGFQTGSGWGWQNRYGAGTEGIACSDSPGYLYARWRRVWSVEKSETGTGCEGKPIIGLIGYVCPGGPQKA